MRLRCLLGLHEEEYRGKAERLGSDLMFINYKCQFCNKSQSTTFGYDGVNIGRWE